MNIARVLVACLALAVLSPSGFAKEEEDKANPHLWKTRVTSVAVFKNGLGFFVRKGEVRLREGWCLAREIPPAAFGTLAVYSHREEELVDVVGSGPGEQVAFDGIDAPKDVRAKLERLGTCLDLNVQLTYRHRGEDRTAAGRLAAAGPEFAVLESEGARAAVPVEDVVRLQVLDLPIRVHVSSTGPKREEPTTLGMAYLSKGITWIPEYTLRILGEDAAELTLRGTLINEAEDLVHCNVSFVVGVPHFAHSDYLSPLAVGQVIRTIGAHVAPRELQTQIMNRAAYANDLVSASSVPGIVERPVAAPPGDTSLNLPQWEGAGASDYTVYEKKDMTVRRGEKAVVTLFVQRIRFSHLHRWSPPAALEHLLVLENGTETAWTTGPLLAVNGDTPLSEDLLRYVPKGGRGEIPVTTAINIAHERRESEEKRQMKVYEPSHNFFVDLVTLQGELQLRNFDKVEADVVVIAPVPGKPITASDGGKLEADPDKLSLLERQGVLRWRLALKPGEARKLTYAYERYVPSR